MDQHEHLVMTQEPTAIFTEEERHQIEIDKKQKTNITAIISDEAQQVRLRDEVSGAARVADLDATGGKAFDLRAEIAARVQGLMKKQDDIK